MKLILPIFALLMVASCDTKNDNLCQFSVTDSPANPIEWWSVDCNTSNETEVCGVHHKCFCAPWNCDDQINDQFTDTVDAEYNLKVLSEEGDALALIPYTKNIPQLFDPIEDWTQGGGGEVWSGVGTSSPSVTLPSGSTFSNLLLTSIVPPSVALRVVYDFDNSAVACDLVFRFRFSGSAVTPLPSTVALGVGNTSGYFDITLDSPADDFTIEIQKSSGAGTTISLNSIKLYKVSNVTDIITYFASFIPSDYDICDQQVTFQRVTDTSPEEIVRKADCFDIRLDHPCTKLIEYWNNKDILGLVYTTGSPQTTFFIRVYAEFFHEDFPEEEEVMELTQSVEVLNSQIMEKKFMRINYAPYYLHRKLKYIFKHQFILIDGDYWARGDEYKIIEGNRMWPVKLGEVWLTNKNSVQRAVL